ncbi:MAG: S9 family peptidase [Verrucomicrobia bacterium]|nr:S9 family peptidase [Verrucomicrobiota bacterium]
MARAPGGFFAGVLGLGLLASFCPAAEPPPDPSLLTLDRIFAGNEFNTGDDRLGRWLKDGSGYTRLEPSPNLKQARDLVRYDPATGARTVLVPASRLIPPGATEPLNVDDYAWSDNHRRLLLFTNSRRVWRQNTRGDYWVLDLASGRLRQLGSRTEPATLMFATFSPDARRVAYVWRHNLYVQDLDDLRITPLTADGSDTVINGTADWVCEEEFYLRRAFRWSPDSTRIAYWQFDVSHVPEYHLLNTTASLYPQVTSFRYPKAGQTNAACRVGVVPATGGPTRWFHPNPDPRNHYIPEMEWAPDSTSVVFQELNRLQNRNRLVRARVRSGRMRDLHVEADDAWVDVNADWHWLGAGSHFLWLSEKAGWRQLYRISKSGREKTLLTPGAYDVVRVAGIDEALGWVYIIASPDDSTQRYLYRVPLRHGGPPERVTPADRPGTHAYSLSPDARWAFHTRSRFGQPPVSALIRLPEHRTVRLLADNAKLQAALDALKPTPAELFRVAIGEGVELDAWCLKPPEFDPARKYPLLLHVYGEPAGQTVLDRWGGDTHLWHRFLAQQGYLVMSFENRGTAAPRGRQWRKCIYRQVGVLAAADQAAALRKVLEQRPYVDPARVGIWGWSGGGSMTLNAIFRYPDLYRAGMAIAFVSDLRFYDTIYQERYMGLPGENDAGYRNGSPITFAHQLKGRLLLVYGTGDDNCHYQNCEALVNELVRHNKPFDMLAYPNRRHGISEGNNTRRHLFGQLTRYLQQQLPRP